MSTSDDEAEVQSQQSATIDDEAVTQIASASDKARDEFLERCRASCVPEDMAAEMWEDAREATLNAVRTGLSEASA